MATWQHQLNSGGLSLFRTFLHACVKSRVLKFFSSEGWDGQGELAAGTAWVRAGAWGGGGGHSPCPASQRPVNRKRKDLGKEEKAA